MASSEPHYILPRPEFDKPVKILIAVAPYYKDIAEQLVAGAVAEIEAAGGFHEVIEVPGALELPTAIGIAGRMSNFDGYVALGCVIRGETTHYDTVCNDSARGLTLLGLQGLCIGNGILTVENHDQAWARAETAGQNKGGGAAAAALHLIALARRWGSSRKGVGFVPARDEYQVAGTGAGKDTA
ncbi:6,7-dimethyl-8-ribityllumazine synthase [Salipiger aestuarii]|uniref:6,7-dimethyl-8-ribityllumazine synthase n=1 Tax=Salipiger aestuarii TaxID=568098 RepID=A0A327XYX8_9RHOB|nr:6,7-dimethyl-8-ribityllumazine synthase [Salipiger aestuarii]EIE53157.1 6,7-dimethyl-8-ribityllumazine synthase [Citreicella sp. 357]KAA8605559.1 6,7-dimethyl-8-ribityllumazine synthase [Salipiger aestuarii]KAA8608966.1 6,7-dimethyl-8-ribityllumazine synthase [Salipiger aestuarii]KAB2541177.1 6,7-dimethyl-8-ribityllumazine synthase [Salipiger aestuarii]RAK13814.1 6,7-dimethyl-8-ribityllumazine synthase [Salipiger aestuarii]